MKNILTRISFLIGLLVVISCAEEQAEDVELFGKSDSYYIEFGTECGWCAGTEYIKITQSKAEYTRVIPCDDNKGATTKSRALDASDWEDLTNSYNIDDFMELDYNTCNLCADGCDEIIRIGNIDTVYQIRYTPGIEIEEIETLREKLNDFMQEFNQNN